jgi:ABC-type polysaccharide/polyol phosphate export permease
MSDPPTGRHDAGIYDGLLATRENPSDGVPYALFAYSGLLPWTFFWGAVANDTTSMVAHASLITKVRDSANLLLRGSRDGFVD